MKNLSHYSESTFEFHQEVLDSKQDQEYKNRIIALNPNVMELFSSYDENFDQNTLESIRTYGYGGGEKIDLLRLYSYRNSVIQRLKTSLITTDTNRIANTCPNCTINEINCFDHYLPKDEYPEYVVNPKNLLPSCTVCNGHKSTNWRIDGVRLFLNLYLDSLPSSQYLFVKLTFEDDIVTPSFLIENNGIPDEIFNIISTHYQRLHLLERFNENSHDIIIPLENTIKSFKSQLSHNSIRDSIIEKINKDKIAFGQNYWKSILEQTLVESHEFMNRFVG